MISLPSHLIPGNEGSVLAAYTGPFAKPGSCYCITYGPPRSPWTEPKPPSSIRLQVALRDRFTLAYNTTRSLSDSDLRTGVVCVTHLEDALKLLEVLAPDPSQALSDALDSFRSEVEIAREQAGESP